MAWKNLRSFDPAKLLAKHALLVAAGVSTGRVTLCKFNGDNPHQVQGNVIARGRRGEGIVITRATDLPMFAVTVAQAPTRYRATIKKVTYHCYAPNAGHAKRQCLEHVHEGDAVTFIKQLRPTVAWEEESDEQDQ